MRQVFQRTMSAAAIVTSMEQSDQETASLHCCSSVPCSLELLLPLELNQTAVVILNPDAANSHMTGQKSKRSPWNALGLKKKGDEK